jgi:hypothetical protein
MNTAIGNVASGNPSLGRRKWWLLVPVLLLDLLSAFAFNKFAGAAAYYSARIPITSVTPPDEAVQITHAHQSAGHFFLLFVGLIVVATLLLAPVIHLNETSSGRFRLPTRYILVLVLCILAVGAMVHVFFVYSAAVAALVALLMTPAVQDKMGPDVFRLVVRYGLALVLCVLTTGLLVWIMAALKL